MASPERTTKSTARKIWDVVSLVVVALASTAAGFVAVVSSAGPERLRQGTWLTQADELAAVDAGAGGDADAGDAATDAVPVPEVARETALHEVGGVPIQPAPRLKLGGEPFYWRCWDSGSTTPLHEGDCDRMRPFERLIASRLGVVARCYERLDRPDATGVLSLAVEVDFGPTPPPDAATKTKAPAKAPAGDAGAAGSIRFWSSQSTTLEGAEAIINCIRRDLDEIPLDGITHRRQKYTIFFPIEFLGTADDEGGTPVELVLDKVRLREAPENGKIVARLRKGEPVRVLEVREGWARVKTADAQEGWLYVDAIKLTEE